MTQSIFQTLPILKLTSIVEVLRWRAIQQSEQQAYTFLVNGKVEGLKLTYGELDYRSRAIAAFLQKQNAQGERALLLYPQGLEVIAAFFGSLYSQVIAIPAPPPEASRLKSTVPRLQAIAKDAQATLVLTTSEIISQIKASCSCIPEFDAMRWIDTEEIPLELAEEWQEPVLKGDTLAYLQYTSGSTSIPKGVMISHENVIHHSAYLNKAFEYTPDSISVTWMPYFHDYGLVEGLLQPLYNGTPCYLMSPFAFIKRPFHWLQAISHYQATHSHGPNFAYDLCVHRISPEQKAKLNLSSWCVAGNGAELINVKVLESFFETFEACGFRWHSFAPSYGLAENTLAVSVTPKMNTPVFCTISTEAQEKNQIVEVDKNHSHKVRTIVGCGRLVGNTKVVIVNLEKLICVGPNEIGEIWVSDSSVAQGYWNRPEDTEDTFRNYLLDTGEGPFMRTGDMGFIKDGELFITGRIKDLIIIKGTNHYPHDIEWTVQKINPVLRPNYGVAFSIESEGEERLIIVQEVERQYQGLNTDEVIASIRQVVAEQYELQVYAVVLVRPGNILKTSSGKIQRRACQFSFLAGELEVLAHWCENSQLVAQFGHLQIDS